TKLCNGIFRVTKLPAQFDQTVAQPTRGALGQLKASIELVGDISISNRIGELCGSFRIVPSYGNVEDLSLPAARNCQRSAQVIDSSYDSFFRCRGIALIVLGRDLRILCLRWRKLLDSDPSQQRVGPQDGKL